MKTEVIFNFDLHFEHNLWKLELSFWKSELNFFKKRLTELVNKWTNKNMLAELEQYQNKFIIQESNINKLQLDISNHEIRISESIKTGKDVLDLALFKKHLICRNQIETQRHVYSELKKHFFLFMSKYM